MKPGEKLFQQRLNNGQASGQPRFLLVNDGELPDVFEPLEHHRVNICGNVWSEMLPVWTLLEQLAESIGYQVVKRQGQDDAWRLEAALR